MTLHGNAPPPPAKSSPGGISKPKFSFDLSFFHKSRAKKLDSGPSTPSLTRSDSGQDRDSGGRKLFRKLGGQHTGKPKTPSPIITRNLQKQYSSSSHSPTANVRLCQSPGGRANVQLAIPITPPSATHQQYQQHHRRSSEHQGRVLPRHSSFGDRPSLSRYSRMSSVCSRSSFSFGPWRETSMIREVWRESSVADFLACFPRDLVVDVATVCDPLSLRDGRQHMRRMLQQHLFEIRSTKWAAYFLLLVKQARQSHQLPARAAVSLQWVICAYVKHEVATRTRKLQLLDEQMHKKMTEYRVAMECISGTAVLKYGRKGKPHPTQLVVENCESLRWTSKLLSGRASSKAKKSIALASILEIRAGPSTDVLARALHKGTLALQDAKCTLSLVTRTRTFDIKAKNAAERDWLHRSFAFLISLAHEHEKRVAQQVELSIMKRMEMQSVWKHGRKGRPHKTRLFINRFGEISWQGRSGDSMQLDDILAIEAGQQTTVFARSLNHGLVSPRNACRCFSLVTYTRTLDIEADSEHQRDWFVVAFRYLMDKVQEKTAAIKREKAEKQLKLLQELCGGLANVTPAAPAHG